MLLNGLSADSQLVKNKFMKSVKHKLISLVFATAMTSVILSIALFVSIYRYLGIDEIFSEKMKNSIQKTVEIANLYLQEHVNTIKFDIISLQKKLEEQDYLAQSRSIIDQMLNEHSQLHDISEIIIFNKKGKVLASNMSSFSLTFSDIPLLALQKANMGEIYLRRLEYDRVHAIIKLNVMYPYDLYMLVGKKIDENIIINIEEGEKSAASYSLTKYQIERLTQPVFYIFCTLYIALFAGFIFFANRLGAQTIEPLTILTAAAARIRDGQYEITISEKMKKDDFFTLLMAFKKMSSAIKLREEKLKKASDTIKERMNFTAAIISQVSSGIIVIEEKTQRIILNNQAAIEFFLDQKAEMIFDAFPEFKTSLATLNDRNTNEYSNNISIARDGKRIEILIKIKKLNKLEAKSQKILIAINDTTAISFSERMKAWSNIAQKVAHEIKNPLTPIQLAIERIQEKFCPQDDSDRERFLKYTNTVINRVDDIQTILQEFIHFARIPSPHFQKEDIITLAKEALLLEQGAHQSIKYKFDSNQEKCYIDCDRMQISQVFTNLLKNAAEAIFARLEGADDKFAPLIIVRINETKANDMILVEIVDNGCGIDADNREALCQPYFTTKKNGSGLGLSVVSKIIADHGADGLSLQQKTEGTVASFTIPYAQSNTKM